MLPPPTYLNPRLLPQPHNRYDMTSQAFPRPTIHSLTQTQTLIRALLHLPPYTIPRTNSVSIRLGSRGTRDPVPQAQGKTPITASPI